MTISLRQWSTSWKERRLTRNEEIITSKLSSIERSLRRIADSLEKSVESDDSESYPANPFKDIDNVIYEIRELPFPVEIRWILNCILDTHAIINKYQLKGVEITEDDLSLPIDYEDYTYSGALKCISKVAKEYFDNIGYDGKNKKFYYKSETCPCDKYSMNYPDSGDSTESLLDRIVAARFHTAEYHGSESSDEEG